MIYKSAYRKRKFIFILFTILIVFTQFSPSYAENWIPNNQRIKNPQYIEPMLINSNSNGTESTQSELYLINKFTHQNNKTGLEPIQSLSEQLETDHKFLNHYYDNLALCSKLAKNKPKERNMLTRVTDVSLVMVVCAAGAGILLFRHKRYLIYGRRFGNSAREERSSTKVNIFPISIVFRKLRNLQFGVKRKI